jgi:hypothetical protein
VPCAHSFQGYKFGLCTGVRVDLAHSKNISRFTRRAA